MLNKWQFDDGNNNNNRNTEFYEVHCRKSSHVKERQAEVQTIPGRDTETLLDTAYHPCYREANGLIYSLKKIFWGEIIGTILGDVYSSK